MTAADARAALAARLVDRRAADLPVAAALPALLEALGGAGRALLSAPPGSGKTTLVPLALLDAPWREGGRIVMLEPRRVAARAAARRMASLLGEEVGGTVGVRMRMDTRVGAATAIEVVTEGVFTRMAIADPTLSGIAAVLVDEFHERSLDADLALALSLEAADAFRPDLRILAMSATLDVAGLKRALPEAPVVEAEGRVFPVATRHRPPRPRTRRVSAVVDAVFDALLEETGSVLAFLPGRAEVEAAAADIRRRVTAGVEVHALHGGVSGKAQDAAIAPPPAGGRKVVVATAIAETSVTIDGVRVVVDAGYARRPVHDRETGLTRLETGRVSLASAEQRRGRAGRTAPGVCIRLWHEGQTGALAAHDPPEILTADLSGLVLTLAAEGIGDPRALPLVDPPPEAAVSAARARLTRLGALDRDGRITDRGRALALLPMEPPLAAMVLAGAAEGRAGAFAAALLAAATGEPALREKTADASATVAALARSRGGPAGQARRLAEGWAETALEATGAPAGEDGPLPLHRLGVFAAAGYPERIAEARGGPGRYRLASGRGAAVEADDPVAAERFLAVLDVTGGGPDARILFAVPLPRDALFQDLADLAEEERVLAVSDETGHAEVLTRRRIGAVVTAERVERAPPGAETEAALAAAIARRGLSALPLSDAAARLLARVRYAAEDEDARAALSDEALAGCVADWLLPFVPAATSLADIGARTVEEAFAALAAERFAGALDRLAPPSVEIPGRQPLPVDYGDGRPVVRARVQDLFGYAGRPETGRGERIAFELLSPAGRPIQVTDDLAGFWAGSWKDVRKDLRGRYPKHHWPEDPATAEPTRMKPR